MVAGVLQPSELLSHPLQRGIDPLCALSLTFADSYRRSHDFLANVCSKTADRVRYPFEALAGYANSETTPKLRGDGSSGRFDRSRVTGHHPTIR